jgi:hypothetical protein
MTEPRPNKLTPEMAICAARNIAEDLARDGLIDDIEATVRDIAKHGRSHQDGYELAKILDARCYWDCDLATAEILDGFSSCAHREIEIAEREWASRNDITAPFPLDTAVKLHSGETGIITDIYKYGAAKFCIKIDGDAEANSPMQARRIVNFEDVAALWPHGRPE